MIGAGLDRAGLDAVTPTSGRMSASTAAAAAATGSESREGRTPALPIMPRSRLEGELCGHASFSYAAPRVLDATEVPTHGGELIVTGENFGELMEQGHGVVTTTTKEGQAEITVEWFDAVARDGTGAWVRAESVSVVVPHSVIRCVVGAGIDMVVGGEGDIEDEKGEGQSAGSTGDADNNDGDRNGKSNNTNSNTNNNARTPLRVTVAGISSNGTGTGASGAATSRQQELTNSGAFFHRSPPMVVDTFPPLLPPEGGPCEIIGLNFGPGSGPGVGVTVGNTRCEGASVVTYHTKISFDAPPLRRVRDDMAAKTSEETASIDGDHGGKEGEGRGAARKGEGQSASSLTALAEAEAGAALAFKLCVRVGGSVGETIVSYAEPPPPPTPSPRGLLGPSGQLNLAAGVAAGAGGGGGGEGGGASLSFDDSEGMTSSHRRERQLGGGRANALALAAATTAKAAQEQEIRGSLAAHAARRRAIADALALSSAAGTPALALARARAPGSRSGSGAGKRAQGAPRLPRTSWQPDAHAPRCTCCGALFVSSLVPLPFLLFSGGSPARGDGSGRGGGRERTGGGSGGKSAGVPTAAAGGPGCVDDFAAKVHGRHHCRRCGLVVCSRCSLRKRTVHSYTGLHRVCDGCVALEDAAAGGAGSGSSDGTHPTSSSLGSAAAGLVAGVGSEAGTADAAAASASATGAAASATKGAEGGVGAAATSSELGRRALDAEGEGQAKGRGIASDGSAHAYVFSFT